MRSKAIRFGLIRQQGYAELLLLGLLVSVTGYAILEFYSFREKAAVHARATESGRHLQEYVFGVMKYISEEGGAAVAGTYTGADWLKPTSCPGGTAVKPYISNCNYRSKNTFGDEYKAVLDSTGGIVSVEIRVHWPVYMESADPQQGEFQGDGYLAAVIRSTASSHLAGSTPVAQTFADYSLDKATREIVAVVSTAPSSDIWLRTDGSNKMNADTNFDGNALYGVRAIYGDATPSENITTTIDIGSALNVAGVLTVGPTTGMGANYIDVTGADSSGYSMYMIGGLSAAGADFAGRVNIGDGAGAGAYLKFFDSNTPSDVEIRGQAGDLIISNANGDATLIADNIYSQSVNRFMDQAVYNITVASHGDRITAPSCGVRVPQIFTSFAAISGNRPLAAFDINAIPSYGGGTITSWLIDVKIKTDMTSASSGESPGQSKVIAIVKCS